MTELLPSAPDDDRAALRAACQDDVGLCTIVGIAGSYSRRLGAQLAVSADGQMTGSLADGCLERQLVSELQQLGGVGMPVVRRFGAGSPQIDFRLPCGSGIDVLIDPAPDRDACRQAIALLDARRAASLPLAAGPEEPFTRHYTPPPRLLVFGEGPEPAALVHLAAAAGIAVEQAGAGMALGDAPAGVAVDPWTAIVLLYHDHEWEQPLLQWALGTPAFLIGAQGGARTRVQRLEQLADSGFTTDDLARIVSPIGLIPRTREPLVLALSVLAQVVERHEQLHPHG
ncbi:XdhC family protein [Croceibacterium mercuriale]|uniref:XdhC family protein n=1 Tax=Croceibacterium mercuriale TaxID=1572751 RepID=UPI001379291B|nr:XdhC family protein [Croceibacterium mercuriale]